MEETVTETTDVAINQELIKTWLQNKHCTLWQSWDIVSQEGLNNASQWLLDQIQSVAFYAMHGYK